MNFNLGTNRRYAVVIKEKVSRFFFDGNNGLFIKVKDTDCIVEAIRIINSDRNLLNRLSVNARNTIFSKFSTQQYINQLNRIYQEG